MEGIQGLRQQPVYSAPTTVKKETAGTSKPITDTFESVLAQTEAPAETVKPLNLEQIRSIGSRYDTYNMTMTRGQFNSLIKELRDAGAITQKAFSDCYTGAAPREGSRWDMPAGEEAVDFSQLLFRRMCECSHSSDPNGAALAESYDQVERTITRMSANYYRFCETPEEKAARIVSKAYRSPEELGIPDLTGMSDDQKLNLLTKLHKQTDYSGLNDVERYKLISDRFETVFPNRMLYTTYCFGGRIDPSRPWDGSGNRKGMQDYIRDEFDEQLSDAGLYGSFGGTTTLHELAYYTEPCNILVDKDGHCRGNGCDSYTDEELRALISRRHNDGKTAADQAAILQELRMCTQSYNAEGFRTMGIVRSDLFDKLGPDAPPLWDSLDELYADARECDEVLDKILVDKLAERGIQVGPRYPAGRNAGWIDQYMAHRDQISAKDLEDMLCQNLTEELEKNPDWFITDLQRAGLAQRAQVDLSAMLEKILQEEVKKMEDELEETVG